MKKMIFLCALLLTACSQSQSTATTRAGAVVSARGSVSPSAPVNLTYQIESATADQPQIIDIAINTRLNSGTLLVEVAKQEGADTVGETTQRIDLAAAKRPIALQMQAVPLGDGEHYLVLLLTIDTEMGPMSRSFRIDLSPPDTSAVHY